MKFKIVVLEVNHILSFFDKKDKFKLYLVTLVQIFLSIFDLVGLLLIGLLGSVVISGFQSNSIGDRENFLLTLLNIENSSIQSRVAFIGALIALTFSVKTISSILLMKKSLYFVSRRGAVLAAKLATLMFSNSISKFSKFSHQEIIFSISSGITFLTSRVIANLVIVISDFVLLIVLFIGLLLINPVVSISSLLMFTTAIFIINRILKIQFYRLGLEQSKINIAFNEKISELLNTYREATVKNTRINYIKLISEQRHQLSKIDALTNFIPRLNKYLIEIIMIIGILFVSGLQFAINDAASAISNLAIFLAASTRIAPAILRIQQGLINIQGGLGATKTTVEIIDYLSKLKHEEMISKSPDFIYNGFKPNVSIENLEFKYESSNSPALSSINLEVSPGEQVAIVGSSGAGKTTLVDLILGIYSPTQGVISISGKNPLTSISNWPGAIAYVPQEIYIANGSIWDNVTLGLSVDLSQEELVWKALELARINNVVKELEGGLHHQIGENGFKLSGGEKQRIGIARALFTNPKLLILDEATSALDSETEFAIMETLRFLKGSTTVIMIAHRLSSVKNADKVIFLSAGRALSIGTFNEVRSQVPDFEKQANLLGL